MGDPAFFLTALFRAAALAVLALAGATFAGLAPPGADAALLATGGGVAAGALLLRAALRRLDPAGGAAAAGWLALAVTLMLCVQRTGGLESPVLLLVAGVVAVAATQLGPVWNLLFLSGVALVQTLAVLAAGGAAPRPLLLVEGGILALLGFLANRLAGRVRDLESEVLLRDLRDPETGLLKSPLFLARVVALVEARGDAGAGVALLLFEPASGADPAEAAGRLADAAREDDLVGRAGAGLLGVAACCAAEDAPALARRLSRALGAGARAGWAHAGAGPERGDPLETARRLFDEATARLAAERVGFAA